MVRLLSRGPLHQFSESIFVPQVFLALVLGLVVGPWNSNPLLIHSLFEFGSFLPSIILSQRYPLLGAV
jgi:hypothetical protein